MISTSDNLAVFYLGFGQAIAAFSPNELLASILVPLFFLFVVSFCGVVVPAMALPYFWRSWMYWLTVSTSASTLDLLIADHSLAIPLPP